MNNAAGGGARPATIAHDEGLTVPSASRIMALLFRPDSPRAVGESASVLPRRGGRRHSRRPFLARPPMSLEVLPR